MAGYFRKYEKRARNVSGPAGREVRGEGRRGEIKRSVSRACPAAGRRGGEAVGPGGRGEGVMRKLFKILQVTRS